jgi:hypothetical protein
MSDTQRSRTTLQTLFADNTTGEISPQDLRDFLASVKLYTENRFVELTDGATVTVDCSSGNHFYLETSNNAVIAAPTNVSSRLSDKLILRIKATGSDRTITLSGVNPAGFRLGADISALSGITVNKTDYFGCLYNSEDNIWDVVAYVRGY